LPRAPEPRLLPAGFIPRRRGIPHRAAFPEEEQEVPMGYERNDRRYHSGGQDRFSGENRDRGYGYSGDRFGRDQYRGNDYRSDRDRYGPPRDYRGERFDDRNARTYDDQDRSFFDRAGDEVRSWFGDDEAERRRLEDDRNAGHDRDRGFSAYGTGWATEFGLGDPYAYGSESGYGAGNWRGSDQGRRPTTHHDQGYRSWRDRQMSDFDRDYDEYRREHQHKFDSEFSAWREQRQGQRSLLGKVQEHQEVIGSDGQHIGTVDHVRGDQILLTKSDQDAGGHHHLIPCSWIQAVDDRITVSKTGDQAKQHWRDEQRNQDSSYERGQTPNRSFSGTY